MNHELKTDPEVFDQVMDGEKTFEIRKDDRGFNVGDDLLLRKTVYTGEEMKNGRPLEYEGSFWTVSVKHIMRGPIYGLKDGWCIISIDTKIN